MMKNFRSKSKYFAKKVKVNGETYDSTKEYKRYRELLLLEKAGAITDLQKQVKFVLIPAQYETLERYGKNGKRLKDGQRCVEKECSYYADFVYYENGEKVVEDTKGYKKRSSLRFIHYKKKADALGTRHQSEGGVGMSAFDWIDLNLPEHRVYLKNETERGSNGFGSTGR